MARACINQHAPLSLYSKGTMKSSASLYQQLCAALLFALACCSIPAVAAPAGSAIGTAPQGTLVIIGGGLRADNAEVWQRIVALSGGKGARIAVLASAAMNPEKSGESIIRKLNQYGADAFFVPLAVKLPNSDYR